MLLYAIIGVLLVFAAFIILRAVFECIRFCFKMNSLKRRLKKLEGDGVEIQFLRRFTKTAFGDKGKTDFLVKSNGKTYDVSVLAFRTVRGRWNIEKAEDRYYAEVRVYNNMFYDINNNTGDEPQHSKDYKREMRITRKRLYLTPESGEGEKILLVHPKPKALTYTDHKLNYVSSGNKVFGYTILYDDDFFEMFK